MKKDFDFDDIGKRTPYRTPEGFFEYADHRCLVDVLEFVEFRKCIYQADCFFLFAHVLS